MYYVGIDIAKYKHDCFIFTSEGEVVLESQKNKTGLEAAGIYGKNLKTLSIIYWI